VAELPPEEPTAYVYRAVGDRIVADAVKATPTDAGGAQVYFDELRRKAHAMAGQLTQRRDMMDDWVVDSVLGLHNSLPETLSDLNPHSLRAWLRSVRKIADEYELSGNVKEFYREFRAQITDLAESGSDLEACFPELRRVEAEQIARSIPPEQQDAAKARFDEVVAAAHTAPHVDDSAKAGLTEEKAVAESNTSPEEKRVRLGEYGLAVRNFSRVVAKLGADIADKGRDGFVESAADGVKGLGKPAVVGSVALLVYAVAGPVAGLAAFAAGYGKIDDVFKLLKDYFGPPPPGPKT
jgi:hypothetical protein